MTDPSARATHAAQLLATGSSLAVASAASHRLSDQIAVAHAAPELICFEHASHEQLTRLRRVSNELVRAVLTFLEEVQPQLVLGARERMALAVAKAEHVHALAQEATPRVSVHPTCATASRVDGDGLPHAQATNGVELRLNVLTPAKPIAVLTRGFTPNTKQRERLQAIDVSGKPWCPENGGQARMADVLARRGLLTGPHYPGRLYEITEAGRQAASEVRPTRSRHRIDSSGR
ncbi:MAG: hypothetical protein ACTHOE_08750 [Conexibacter sp.]